MGIYNTFCLYNFKNTNYLADISCPHKGVFKFVFLSRLTELKGVFHILNSVKQLNKEGLTNKFKVDFYGRIDSEIESRFYKEIASIQNVEYKGFLDMRRDENYEIISKYDIMLFPTMHPTEGFPGVIADAAIAGLPVIASNWNYAKELIEDCDCGFVFPVGDNSLLTDKMRFSIYNRELLQEKRKNCINRSELYRTKNVLTSELVDLIGMKR